MGVSERREREKQQRQQDILDAAEKIIFSKGLDRATMDDVAEQAELSKGTLYLYFKSKEAIYLAITHRGLLILGKMFRKAVRKNKTGLENVFSIGKAFYDFSRKHPDYFNALSYYELKDTDSEIVTDTMQECSCAGQDVLSILIQTIADGIEDGSVKPKINPHRMALIMWGMSSGIIQLASLKGRHLAELHNFKIQGIVEESFEVFRCVLENND